ncbi:TetR family transcriptional regulator [Algoriphagus aquimarinus]|uniref:Biofilm operon icaADBC HTH-type negative transcriptional regulator IcaR n=1 Tax=Algoriphagus aquimarinus TaxID=237018 RepID=A0A1I0VRY3_9BACT|nr:TetR family transcriptional regulator [Algoriphagus aquimarinus]SFA78690.1 DNA-binding transcriptional regulator, AcrR family [Algoriphagus aquimarinus]|tara:strand:+ start:228233 stop:228835 length:603 start_codon:yes stop_codon:yes gene_type:complete
MGIKISEGRKKEIILGFYQLSKVNGLENTSIAKIGKHLGMPPSLVMHYFPTREILISNLISYILQQMLLIYQPMLKELETQNYADPHTFVDRLFSRDWNLLLDDGVFYSCYSLIFRNKRIKDEYRVLHEKLREYLKDILDRDENLTGKDTELLSEQIFVVVEGAYYYLSMFDDPEVYEQKVTIFKNQVYDLLRKYEVQHL